MSEQPRTLWLARHGESLANVAAARAERSGAATLDIELRDADVPLTDAGVEQASALGRWIAELPQPPVELWVSPYLRAHETARIALERSGAEVPMRVDERLRDRELGVMDLLTSHGVEERFPEEAARRLRLGKFWYRPPGGESWADVALRLRTLLPDLTTASGPVLVVAHDVVVTLFVYLCCGMSEPQIMKLARERAVGNATVTTLSRTEGRWELETFGDTGHLRDADAPVTKHSDEETHADVV